MTRDELEAVIWRGFGVRRKCPITGPCPVCAKAVDRILAAADAYAAAERTAAPGRLAAAAAEYHGRTS